MLDAADRSRQGLAHYADLLTLAGIVHESAHGADCHHDAALPRPRRSTTVAAIGDQPRATALAAGKVAVLG